MAKSNQKYSFNFFQLTKSWHRNKPPPSLIFYAFEADQSVCVVSVLDEYLRRTET